MPILEKKPAKASEPQPPPLPPSLPVGASLPVYKKCSHCIVRDVNDARTMTLSISLINLRLGPLYLYKASETTLTESINHARRRASSIVERAIGRGPLCLAKSRGEKTNHAKSTDGERRIHRKVNGANCTVQ